MAEYSRMAEGVIKYDGTAVLVTLPFAPDFVELLNVTGYQNGVNSNIVLKQIWQQGMPIGTSLTEGYSPGSGNPYIADYVATNGITPIAAGQLNVFGPQIAIASATAGSGPHFTTATPHGLVVGDVVILTGLYNPTPTTGMAQMSNMPFTVESVSSTTVFQVDWNASGSNYSNLSSPTNAYVKKILYPYLYFPGISFIADITVADDGINTQIVTTADNNYVQGQEISFRIPPAWGPIQLNSLPNNLVPGSPNYYYVMEVSSSTVFTVNVPFASLNAFNANQPISAVPGLDYPQVVAVGDVNSGGWPFIGGNLYPSPVTGSGFGNSTINGPAIQGAFVNNTYQGFIVGLGGGSVITSSILTSSGTIVYRAYLHDMYSVVV